MEKAQYVIQERDGDMWRDLSFEGERLTALADCEALIKEKNFIGEFRVVLVRANVVVREKTVLDLQVTRFGMRTTGNESGNETSDDLQFGEE